MSPRITLEDVTITIGEKTICQHLDLQFGQGERWAILGKNGSGKTTLLHTIAGLHPLAAGRITLNNQSLTDLSRREIAQTLGLLMQEYEDHFPGTVLEMVLSGRHPWLSSWQWGSAIDQQIATQALAKVELEDFTHRQITTLSGGERRRAALAMLLTQTPAVYLLDEPTNHLDVYYQHQTLQLISELVLAEQKMAIMILHDVNLAMRYCDHALLLFENTEPLAGKIDEVMTEENLSRLFDYPLLGSTAPHGRIFVPG